MTNEEASCVLHCPDAYGGIYGQKYGEALAHCFDLLKKEPCEDAISRKWLRNAIHNFYKGLIHTPTEEDIQAYIDVAPSVKSQYTEAEIQKIQEMEQAEIEKAYELGKAEQQKMGRWEITEYSPGLCNYHCSECHNISLDIGNYCPNCGAKMVESEEV